MPALINPPVQRQKRPRSLSDELLSGAIKGIMYAVSFSLLLLTVVLTVIRIYLAATTDNVPCPANNESKQIRILSPDDDSRSTTSQKTRINCPIVILGAGMAGSHTAYRLAPIYPNQICIFERNNYIGGRIYDLDKNGNSPQAYESTFVSPQGAVHFSARQTLVKQLADELQIPYAEYDYQSTLIYARGRYYTSIEQMCLTSYTNLTCTTDQNGLSPADQLWKRLTDEYRKKPSRLSRFGNFAAFSRSVIGDEATEFLSDTTRYRSYFSNMNAHSFSEPDFKFEGPLYYPNQGMSQFPKRMIDRAVHNHQAQLYLNDEVLSVDDNPDSDCYPFAIETSRYSIWAKQLVAAINPLGWQGISGSIADEVKSNDHFQAILSVTSISIQCYWPRRWWEESRLFSANIDRIWTKQNCLSSVEIFSQRPEQRFQNLTRTVYDDGLCVDFWASLIAQPSQQALSEELVRELQSIYTDVSIPSPTQIFARVWPDTYHFQSANSVRSNEEIIKWSLNPLPRFNRQQFTLIGEAYFLEGTQWVEGAVKSSLGSLTSQFNLPLRGYEN